MEETAGLNQGAGGRSRRSLRTAVRREQAIDAFWALFSFGLALAMIATGGLGETDADQRGFDWLAVPVAAGTSLPLFARRRAPVAVFLVVMVSFAVLLALRYPPDVPVAPAVALFTLAQVSGRGVPSSLAVSLAVGSFLGVGVTLNVTYDDWRAPEAPFTALLWLAIWLAGRGSRLKQEYISGLEERAERAERDAERERRLAAAEERTRIARDLHDSAGHAINVILVEAGAARLLRDRDPERAEEAIETIEKVAREQIDEIDRLVHALREGDRVEKTALAESEVVLGMERGRAAVAALFDLHRATGLELEISRTGEGRALGPSVGRAVFRLLQESLTNAARHGSGSAQVEFKFGAEAVEVSVANPTTNGEPLAEGHGLAGMRERASLLGGTFEAAKANGIFRVRAVLPYDPRYRAPAHDRAAEKLMGTMTDSGH